MISMRGTLLPQKTEDFVEDALRAGYSVDELLLTETLLRAKAKSVDSNKFSRRINLIATKICQDTINIRKANASHSTGSSDIRNPSADSICDDQSPKQIRPTMPGSNRRSTPAKVKQAGKKPWHGPLPKPRVSPPMTLGDARVMDKRSDPGISSEPKVLKQALPVTQTGDDSRGLNNSRLQGHDQVLPRDLFVAAAARKSKPLNNSDNQGNPTRSEQVGKQNMILIRTINGPALFRAHTGISQLQAKAGVPPSKRKHRNPTNPKPPSPGRPRLTYAEVAAGRSTSTAAPANAATMADQQRRMDDRKGFGSREEQGYNRGSRRDHDQGYGYGGRPYRGRGTRRYQARYPNSNYGRGRGHHVPNNQQASTNAAENNNANQVELARTEQAQNDRQKEKIEEKITDDSDSKNRPAAVPEPAQKDSKQKKVEEFCFRCYQPNHDKSVCTTELLCDICEGTNHLTVKCPHNKGPKLVAQTVGFAVQGLGYQHIDYTPPPEPKKSSKTALVTVEGGDMEAAQVVEQLKRLMPGKWNWTAETKKKNVFIVPFPSKTDLARAVAFGSADIKSIGRKLLFEEYNETAAGDPIPLVWLEVHDIPKNLRVKPVLWGIGSMLGATMQVDMKTTLKNDFGRIQVAVLDPVLIPDKLSVAVNRRWYEAGIVVQSIEDEPDDYYLDNDDMDADDMDFQDTNEEKKEDYQTADHGKEQDNTKGNNAQPPKQTDRNIGVQAAVTPDLVVDKEDDIESKKTAFYTEIIDRAIDIVIDEMAAKVAAEEDDTDLLKEGVVEDACTDSDEDTADIGATINPVVRLEQTVTPKRSSLRTQQSSLQDSLQRATQLKARKNLEEVQGYFQDYVLDKNLEQFSEGGGTRLFESCSAEARGVIHGGVCGERMEI